MTLDPTALMPLSGSSIGIARFEHKFLRAAFVALVVSTWLSSGLFGAYILAFYGAAVPKNSIASDWNQILPGIYEPNNLAATAGMALHFVMGGILLILGPIQLMSGVRKRMPVLHRWLGRSYISAAFLAGIGGLAFIIGHGTIGGVVMDAGFGLYGVLMVMVSVQAYRKARARQFEQHRAWAIRLFALAIGSWLFRMDYGFWHVLTGGIGHNHHYNGPFDQVMTFFFYLPNLAVAEIFIRDAKLQLWPGLRSVGALAVGFATLFICVGSYYFAVHYWLPPIVALLG